MSGLARHIAAWEFSRFFKWRDLILSIVLTVGMVGFYGGLSWWQNRQTEPTRVVAVQLDGPELALPEAQLQRFAPGDLSAVRERVRKGELDAAVLEQPPADAQGTSSYIVIAREQADWLASVYSAIAASSREASIARLGITTSQLDVALSPPPIAFEWTDAATSASASVLALVLGVTVLVTLFIGLGYLFIGITSEKQQRVTEQLFSLASPQTIIDGKLLGIGALAFVMTMQYAVVAVVATAVFGGSSLSFLTSAAAELSLPIALAMLLFAVLGFALWLSLCAAVFATINDPNSSQRNSVLMLPMIPFVAVFVALDTPDGGLMILLSHLPLTAVAAMPARLALGDAAWWELVVSLVLLATSVWFARRLAGRIFEAAMLIYGKEPTLGEMWRWARGR